MSLLKRIIRNEDRGRRFRYGTIVSDPTLQNFNTGTAPVWVADVDLGSNRVLKDVLIKGIGGNPRFHAQRGQTVRLERNAVGRLDIVGPGDKLAGIAIKKTYDLGVATETTSASLGFQFIVDPFEFYANLPNPGFSRWNDGTTPWPSRRVLDAQGNPV